MAEETGAMEIAACYFLTEEYLMTRNSGKIWDGEDMINAFVAGAQWAQGMERTTGRNRRNAA